jgi:hypothetical protein
MVLGRLRLGITSILQLLLKSDSSGPKQDIWDVTLDEAIQALKIQLVKDIDDLLNEDPEGMHTTQTTSFYHSC